MNVYAHDFKVQKMAKTKNKYKKNLMLQIVESSQTTKTEKNIGSEINVLKIITAAGFRMRRHSNFAYLVTEIEILWTFFFIFFIFYISTF